MHIILLSFKRKQETGPQMKGQEMKGSFTNSFIFIFIVS